MNTLFFLVVLVAPVAAFLVVLARRGDLQMLILFSAAAVGILAIALFVGYQDHQSNLAENPNISTGGLGPQLAVFGMIGLIVADWLALIWGACYWLTQKRGEPSHPGDRGGATRARPVASSGRGMTK